MTFNVILALKGIVLKIFLFSSAFAVGMPFAGANLRTNSSGTIFRSNKKNHINVESLKLFRNFNSILIGSPFLCCSHSKSSAFQSGELYGIEGPEVILAASEKNGRVNY